MDVHYGVRMGIADSLVDEPENIKFLAGGREHKFAICGANLNPFKLREFFDTNLGII